MSVKNLPYEIVNAGRVDPIVPGGIYNAPRPTDLNMLRLMPMDQDYRVRHIENFYALPRLAGSTVLYNISGTFADAEVEKALLANRDYEVTGTNMTNALVTYSTSGGCLLTTAGGTADSATIEPLSEASVKADGGSGATYGSFVGSVAWDSTKRPWFRTIIKTGAAAAFDASVVWAGFKLTSTSVVATDDDQFFFRVAKVAETVNYWTVTSSNTGTDETTTTTVSATAATQYLLEVKVDGNRYPYFFINGQLVKKGAQLKNSVTTFKPYVGTLAVSDAVAKTLEVRMIDLSQDRS